MGQASGLGCAGRWRIRWASRRLKAVKNYSPEMPADYNSNFIIIVYAQRLLNLLFSLVFLPMPSNYFHILIPQKLCFLSAAVFASLSIWDIIKAIRRHCRIALDLLYFTLIVITNAAIKQIFNNCIAVLNIRQHGKKDLGHPLFFPQFPQ